MNAATAEHMTQVVAQAYTAMRAAGDAWTDFRNDAQYAAYDTAYQHWQLAITALARAQHDYPLFFQQPNLPQTRGHDASKTHRAGHVDRDPRWPLQSR